VRVPKVFLFFTLIKGDFMKTKNVVLIIIAAVALGVGGFVWQHHSIQESSVGQGHHDVYYCPMHPQILYDHPGHCPICGMDLVKKVKKVLQEKAPAKTSEKKILYWTDTMLPGYKSDHPGKSPMGMDLTPVYEKDPVEQDSVVKGYTVVDVSASRQQLIGLRTMLVERKPIVKSIRAFGVISSNLELYQTQNNFIDAYVAYVNVHRDYKRISDHRDTWGIHRDLQTRLLEAQDKLLKLGLGQKEISKLQDVSWLQVGKQPKLMFFNDSRNYWVMAQVFEQDYSSVSEGQTVEVSIPALHDKIKGVIRSVGGFIDPASRSVTVLIELAHYSGQLAANMLVDVTIPLKLGKAVFVPRGAVMDTGLRKIVFVSKSEDTFEPREIKTGVETDDGFEIKSGLKEGESIVVGGNFLLDSESRVQAGLDQGDSHE